MVNSRQQLVDYCLRRLGAPVIEINVDEDQIEDRIDDALQFYQEYHADATMRMYVKYQLTQTDINNKYITVTDNILYIKRILPLSNRSSSVNMFDVKYQLHLNDIYDLSYIGDLVHYEMVQQYIALLDMSLNGLETISRYNRHMNRIYLDIDWESDVKADDYVILECMTIVDPQQFSDIYNDMFLKQYATQLIKQQWGANLIKFEGMQLPGGVTLNGRQIYEDATAEIERIREQMQLNYELPVDFYCG